jgi:hypothetical protein
MREMKEPLSEIRESEDAQPGDGGSGGHLLRDISNEMVGLFKQLPARPSSARRSSGWSVARSGRTPVQSTPARTLCVEVFVFEPDYADRRPAESED